MRYLHIGALALGIVAILRVAIGSGTGSEPSQPSPEKPPLLVVASPDGRVEITAEKLAELPRESVSIKADGGATIEYEGVLVSELVKLVGVKLGGDLRGPLLARYALVEAADGYRVVFSLTELDQEVTERAVLLADRRDGQPLDAKEGPLRIVIALEKRHARWVREVTAIHVREAPRVAGAVEK
ncbi:MAG TPA: molybdopterin-dependent oxidoreductase [Pirellulales bacterium]|nr:molybdopterin-dependent oxidoreductase [Pirellulales bacterium]